MTTILLTGAAGKVGKHVLGALSRCGFEVVGSRLARPPGSH
jgi:nucleoside-diphosphate-sugar epimerase